MMETFDNWNVGVKLIFISTVIGILSLFMKWVDMLILSATGFQQQGYLSLILYIYAVVNFSKTSLLIEY